MGLATRRRGGEGRWVFPLRGRGVPRGTLPPGPAGMAVLHGMLANLANLPAISVPAGSTADGLPVGLQVIGPRYGEDLLLAAAARYERARPWPRHAPIAR